MAERLQGMCDVFLEALATAAQDRAMVGYHANPIADAAGIPKELRDAVLSKLKEQRLVQLWHNSPQGRLVLLTAYGLAEAFELRRRPPYGCLECCRAIVHLDNAEVALGMGLRVTDVVRRSRLEEAVVRRCLAFLTREDLLREPAFEGRGDFWFVRRICGRPAARVVPPGHGRGRSAWL